MSLITGLAHGASLVVTLALGHYGTPALVAVITAIALLVVHLAVPFAVRDHSQELNDFGIEDELLNRADVAEEHDLAGHGWGSPGTTLTGIVLALVGTALLFVMGFVPVPLLVARFAGWALAFLAAIGGFIATASSALWTGVGFTTLLRLMIPGNAAPGERFWVISPVLVMAGALVLTIFCLKTMAGVIAKRDGLRDQAQGQLRGAIFALILICCVAALPWSMQIVGGEERRAAGQCGGAEICEPSYTFFSAYGHGDSEAGDNAAFADFGGILAIAENTAEFEPSLFGQLAFSIQVMDATAWVVFLLTCIATLGPLLSSAFKLPAAARFSPGLQLLGLPMIAWAAVHFVLAASYQWKPSYDDVARFGGPIADQTWIPGILGFAVGVFIVMLALNQVHAVKALFSNLGGLEKVAKSGHSFD